MICHPHHLKAPSCVGSLLVGLVIRGPRYLLVPLSVGLMIVWPRHWWVPYLLAVSSTGCVIGRRIGCFGSGFSRFLARRISG
jgi:hypothetical protein